MALLAVVAREARLEGAAAAKAEGLQQNVGRRLCAIKTCIGISEIFAHNGL